MITLEHLIGINQSICNKYKQKSIMINENNLLSALSVQQWYDSDELLSAALFRSIIIAHGFQDGNKRTAVAISYDIKHFKCSNDEVVQCSLNVATGKLKDVQEIASILYTI